MTKLIQKLIGIFFYKCNFYYSRIELRFFCLRKSDRIERIIFTEKSSRGDLKSEKKTPLLFILKSTTDLRTMDGHRMGLTNATIFNRAEVE